MNARRIRAAVLCLGVTSTIQEVFAQTGSPSAATLKKATKCSANLPHFGGDPRNYVALTAVGKTARFGQQPRTCDDSSGARRIAIWQRLIALPGRRRG